MSKEQKTTLQLYYAYIFVIITNVIPSSTIQTFGMILFIVILIATYYFRSKSNEGSFQNNHMTYITKSIWISSLALLVGMITAYFTADHSIIYNAYNAIKMGTMMTEAQINSLIMDYMRANMFTFLFTLMPSLIYLVYRLCKGIAHAQKNYIIPNLKSWI